MNGPIYVLHHFYFSVKWLQGSNWHGLNSTTTTNVPDTWASEARSSSLARKMADETLAFFPYVVPNSVLSDLGIMFASAVLERKKMSVLFFNVEFSFTGSYSLRISICFGVSAGDRIKRKRQRLPIDAGMRHCWVSYGVCKVGGTCLIRLWQSQPWVWGPWQGVAEVSPRGKGSSEIHKESSREKG